MLRVALGAAEVAFTGRAEGDLGSAAERETGPSPRCRERRRLVADRPWTWLRQVHGARVVRVGEPGAHAGEEADAAVTAVPGAALAILTADCAPVMLSSDEGVVGAAHAGWRGIVAGVIGETVEAMRALGATTIRAALGPCIGPECYEFSPADLDTVAAAVGDEAVRATTGDGRPALDVPAAVRAVLADLDVAVSYQAEVCTACGPGDWFSHRARNDAARQAGVVWLG